MKTISRYIMTLALLLTAVTGAWATDDVILKELTVPSEWNNDKTYLTVDEMTGFKDCSSLTEDEAKALLNSVPTGNVVIFYGAGASSNSIKFVYHSGDDVDVADNPVTHDDVFYIKNDFKFYYTAEPAITVAWNASTKTGTFSMPGSDVVLTPIYAKAAAFATTGTGTEATTLLPEAAEGVIAGTDAPLIAEGTGIVAFAGTSTTVKQGTLMYAVTPATVTEAPALDAANKWSADVPTAKTVADGGIDVLVWYYIQGADAPEGEAATLDNTFDDTEPACLTVQVLSNKFDIQFNAANANTIEAGKATVTVAGAAATVTDGKLQGVKMGSEVKLEAKPGYKFRKVEVKKKEATPAADIVWDATNVSGLIIDGYGASSYEKEGVTLSANAGDIFAAWNNSTDPTKVGIAFEAYEPGGFTFTAPTGKAFTKIEMKANGSVGWSNANLGTGWAFNNPTVTWTGSAASTVKLLTGANGFNGDNISYIAFYLSE